MAFRYPSRQRWSAAGEPTCSELLEGILGLPICSCKTKSYTCTQTKNLISIKSLSFLIQELLSSKCPLSLSKTSPNVRKVSQKFILFNCIAVANQGISGQSLKSQILYVTVVVFSLFSLRIKTSFRNGWTSFKKLLVHTTSENFTHSLQKQEFFAPIIQVSYYQKQKCPQKLEPWSPFYHLGKQARYLAWAFLAQLLSMASTSYPWKK